MTACLGCLRATKGEAPMHIECSRRLFGSDVPPTLELSLAEVQSVALRMIGRSSLGGVQRKISLDITRQRRTLVIDLGGRGRFILKPQTPEYDHLPENEHVSMLLASRFGLTVPPLGLVRLADGSLAYLIARFDRPPDGSKRRQEDFCQLRLLHPADKYHGSAVESAEVVAQFSGEPGADLVSLFETFVFAFWIANGDHHQKNMSLLDDGTGRHLLSPVYDQVCTSLYPDLDHSPGLPLTPGGRRASTAAWLEFARACRLPPKAIDRILARPARLLAEAIDLVGCSYLPPGLADRYATAIVARADRLSAVRQEIGALTPAPRRKP